MQELDGYLADFIAHPMPVRAFRLREAVLNAWFELMITDEEMVSRLKIIRDLGGGK